MTDTTQIVSFNGSENRELLDQIGRLRIETWTATGTTIREDVPRGSWIDEDDEKSTHFAVLNGTQLLAASRFTVYNDISEISYGYWLDSLHIQPQGPFAGISRLVVKTSAQHQGLGKLLDKNCIALARNKNCHGVLCEVPSYRINSLLKQGFEVIQNEKPGWYFPDMMWSTMYLAFEKDR